jgi:hypothetical protein
VLGRELLQGGLPVQAGAHRGRGGDERVEEPVDDLGGGLEAAAELRSFIRGSRVKNPARFNVGRNSGSACSNARATP